MSKFNVGDRIGMHGLQGVFILIVAEVLPDDRYKTIVEESTVMGYQKGDHYHLVVSDLFYLMDDPLPEVVNTLLYEDKRQIRVEKSTLDTGKVYLAIDNTALWSDEFASVQLDPDTALQLAHDLTRQAMAAKRRIQAEQE